jgi:hypothetical protein
MARLRFRNSLSLDGYTAGPEQSVKNPLGIGGEGLHEWVFPLKTWRELHGMKGEKVKTRAARWLGIWRGSCPNSSAIGGFSSWDCGGGWRRRGGELRRTRVTYA